jgi:hypothetical protein
MGALVIERYKELYPSCIKGYRGFVEVGFGWGFGDVKPC